MSTGKYDKEILTTLKKLTNGEGPTANYQIVASTAPFIIDVFSDGNNLFAAKHSNNI